jgi:hypothetical protein
LTSVWEEIAYDGRRVRLTAVQKRHISFFHPEALVNEERIKETLSKPDLVTRGGQARIRVLYKHYNSSPVTSKHLAAVVKVLNGEGFIVTSYFTDKIRRAVIIWRRTDS